MRTYPYAPLTPMQAARRLRNAAVSYGIGLMADANETHKSPNTTRDARLADDLETRVLADMEQLEGGSLEAVAR